MISNDKRIMSVVPSGELSGPDRETEVDGLAAVAASTPATLPDVVVASSEPPIASNAVVVNPDSEFRMSEAEADNEVPLATAIHRVDSLTLALEAIQNKQATAYLALPTASCVGGEAGSDVLLRKDRDSDSGSGSRTPTKRASSLRASTQQLSGSQHSKKAVRFADAMGLDLALVRHVFDLESPPEIPPEATRDLVLPPSDDEMNDDEVRDQSSINEDLTKSQLLNEQQPTHRLYLSPAFAQPGSAPNFTSRVVAQKVVLEQAYYYLSGPTSTSGHIRGLVRVANLGFEKEVLVRATFDAWQSSLEVAAQYQQPGDNCGSEPSDQFAFTFSLPENLSVGDRVTFCVCYSIHGHTYWDNNFGDNYCFHCVAINSAGSRSTSSEQWWSRYI